MANVRRCEVLVVGGGPAGIAAAVRAQSVLRPGQVLLVDAGGAPGGQIWRPSSHPTTGQQKAWLARLSHAGVEVVARAGVYDVRPKPLNGGSRADQPGQMFLAAVEREGEALAVEARRLVLATGARELFLPFPGWTLPGVVGVGGLQALVKSGVNVRDKRLVVAGSGPLLVAVAASLSRAGARVVTIAEQASRGAVARYLAGLWSRPSVLARAIAYRAAAGRSSYRMGCWALRAHGDVCVRAVEITNGSDKRTYDCDLLAVAFGLVPNTELARLAGCRGDADRVVVDERQQSTVEGVYVAGEPTGIGGVDLAIVEGEIAGFAAAGRLDLADSLASKRTRLQREAAALNRAFRLRNELRALARSDTTICRCEDVALGDVHRDWSAREAKLYTRTGMGPCQGRVCGSALHFLYGWPPDAVRPPAHPVLVSTLVSAEASSPSTSPHGASA